jgi:hypothetical protein
MTHTYEHTFRNGVKATATVTDNPPSFAVEWTGSASREVLAEYFGWRETVIADFAERTGKKILVVNIA